MLRLIYRLNNRFRKVYNRYKYRSLIRDIANERQTLLHPRRAVTIGMDINREIDPPTNISSIPDSISYINYTEPGGHQFPVGGLFYCPEALPAQHDSVI